ncbi:MAG: hypothetical protein U0T36_05390 [Saprospiraceae bacterium]
MVWLLGYRDRGVNIYALNQTDEYILGSYNAINGVNVNGLLNQNVNSAWGDLFANVGQVYNRF